jgi:predicted Zn-dependent protease
LRVERFPYPKPDGVQLCFVLLAQVEGVRERRAENQKARDEGEAYDGERPRRKQLPHSAKSGMQVHFFTQAHGLPHY